MLNLHLPETGMSPSAFQKTSVPGVWDLIHIISVLKFLYISDSKINLLKYFFNLNYFNEPH